MTRAELTNFIKSRAVDAGFDKVGIAPAEGVESSQQLAVWLQRGYHGTMAWMENFPSERADPRVLFPGAKSVICLALNYYSPVRTPDDHEIGKISRYAWGDDYHDIVRGKLHELLHAIKSAAPSINGKCCVDTSPMMDKYWAAKAGIGWQGKHTNVITRELGSWVFLGEIILDTDLDYDQPIEDFCGSCNKCIDACPTAAIVEPYVLDSRKCISYLTIEYRGESLPYEMRSKFENWIYGCDICQDVCPWNEKFAKSTGVDGFFPRENNINEKLSILEKMSEDEFQKRFKKSPVKRTKFRGLIRNIKFLLGIS